MIKRSKPLKRTPVKKSRSKPRHGRLKGKDMEALRRFVFERDGYRCQQLIIWASWESGVGGIFSAGKICGNQVTWENGHLAHIVAKRRGGDSPGNTKTSCQECHDRYHRFGPSMAKPVPKKPQ